MPRRKKESFKCPECGQSFALKMHLGRHLSAKHGRVPLTAKSAPAKKNRAKRPGRSARPVGRPAGVAGKLGLRNLSLEQLIQVIAAAKEEAGRRITEFQNIMR